MLRSHNSSEKIIFADYDNNTGDCRRHIVSTRTTVKLSFTDTLLIQTPHYYGQFSLSLGKENPYIFSKFTSLNMDTSLIITGSLLCPWGKKALTFSLNSTLLIQTPHYYGQFALSLGKESPYIFSKFNPLNTDTSLLLTVFFVPGERKPLHFL